MKRVLLSVLTLAWMVLIFSMSSAKGEESGGMSEKAVRLIGKTLYADFEEWEPERQDAFIEKLEFPLRKAAHFTEYMVLGLFMALTLKEWGVRKHLFWIALGLCALYAGSDELHQLFVSGRSGQILDVLIDTAGAAAGSVLLRRKNQRTAE